MWHICPKFCASGLFEHMIIENIFLLDFMCLWVLYDTYLTYQCALNILMLQYQPISDSRQPTVSKAAFLSTNSFPVLGPPHHTKPWSNVKFDQIYFIIFSLSHVSSITMNVYTYQDNCASLARTKFRCDRIILRWYFLIKAALRWKYRWWDKRQ